MVRERMTMTQTPRHFTASGYPPEADPVQLTVHVDVFHDREGGCAVSVAAPDGSELIARYGSRGRALEACRDVIVSDLDALIREFRNEED